MLPLTPPHDTYLIRLPTWGSALIALGIFGLLFSALATAARRRWGAAGLAASAAAGCTLFLAVASTQERYLTTPAARLGMWLSVLFAAFVTFVAPAAVIHHVERREPPPPFARTIGYAVAASYLALLAGGLAVILVAWCVRLVRAAAA